jgi:hypothetical protein
VGVGATVGTEDDDGLLVAGRLEGALEGADGLIEDGRREMVGAKETVELTGLAPMMASKVSTASVCIMISLDGLA